MLPSDLQAMFRVKAFDEEAPFLWSDAEILEYVDAAQKTFIRELGGIRDSQSAVCTLAVTAGATFIPIDASILKVHKAYIPPFTGMPPGPGYIGDLKLVDRESDYARRPITNTGLVSTIYALVFGEDDTGVRPLDVPVVDTTIKLLVSRLPATIVTGSTPLELRAEYHKHLIWGMLAEGYRKQDAETLNNKLAGENEDKFMAEIAKASRDSKLRRASPTPIHYGGI